ncbi:DUF1496 domain-containing protein [Pantoea sp. Eser]|nr:DUF1496 domain-containing protein [Pantoea sp. Eser]
MPFGDYRPLDKNVRCAKPSVKSRRRNEAFFTIDRAGPVAGCRCSRGQQSTPAAAGQRQWRQPDCLRCCIFDYRNYSEGSVVKSEGVLLQCARDEHLLGTNNLIWKIVK